MSDTNTLSLIISTNVVYDYKVLQNYISGVNLNNLTT